MGCHRHLSLVVQRPQVQSQCLGTAPCVLTWWKVRTALGVRFIRALAPPMGAPPPHTTALGVRISMYGSGDIQCPMYTDPMYGSVATAAIAQWSRRGLSAPAGSSPRPHRSLHPEGLCGSPVVRIPEPGFTCAETVAPLSRCFSDSVRCGGSDARMPSPASNGEWSRQSGRTGRSRTA